MVTTELADMSVLRDVPYEPGAAEEGAAAGGPGGAVLPLTAPPGLAGRARRRGVKTTDGGPDVARDREPRTGGSAPRRGSERVYESLEQEYQHKGRLRTTSDIRRATCPPHRRADRTFLPRCLIAGQPARQDGPHVITASPQRAGGAGGADRRWRPGRRRPTQPGPDALGARTHRRGRGRGPGSDGRTDRQLADLPGRR